MKFKYLGRDREGNPVRGEIDALNLEDAKNLITSRGIYIIELKQLKERFFLPKKIKREELIFFSRQISLLLRTGVTLVTSLDIIEENVKSKSFKDFVKKLREYILGGESFSDSLSHFKDIIPEIFIQVVKVGEATGNLDSVLLRISDFFEKEEDLRRKIKNALIYPQIVISIVIIAVIFLLTFVVPIFANIYKGAGVKLPLPTRVLISISNFLVNYWWLLIPLIIFIYLLIKGYLNTESGRNYFDRIKFNLPTVIGKIIRESIFLRISHTLETLIRSGLNLSDTFELLSKVSGNKIIEKSLRNVREKVIQGQSIARAMLNEGIYPSLFVRMVGIGETGGSLEEVLLELENYFEKELDNDIKRFIAMLEPSLTIILGIIVAFIAFSIYLPMFDMISLIKK